MIVYPSSYIATEVALCDQWVVCKARNSPCLRPPPVNHQRQILRDLTADYDRQVSHILQVGELLKGSDAEAGEPPPLSPKQFMATPEFTKFNGIMRKLLKVPKAELDERVKASKELSSRAGNPNAPGRKRKP